MLGHRPRRWPNIETTLDQSLMFAEMTYRARQQILISGASFTITTHLPDMRVGSMLYKCIIRINHLSAGLMLVFCVQPTDIQQAAFSNQLGIIDNLWAAFFRLTTVLQWSVVNGDCCQEASWGDVCY